MKISQETSGWKPEETLQQPHALGQVMVMETLAVLVKQLTAVQGSGALQGGSGSSGGDQRGSTPGRGDGNRFQHGGQHGHSPAGQGGHPPSEGTGMARCRMEEAE